jgi:putative glutamine amidotransferase
LGKSKQLGAKMMKPIIGLTTSYEKKPSRDYQSVSYNYIRAIEAAGGLVYPLPISCGHIEDYFQLVDGILFSGGEDIHPAYYGETPIPQLGEVCDKRDGFETRLFLRALEKKMPVLGICRGLQLMNVALGGTLYQDIQATAAGTFCHQVKDKPVDALVHRVTLPTDGILCEILKTDTLEVNSLHHQAIHQLGDGLEVVALSFDNIIEGIAYKGESFAVGVQWHPEDLLAVHNPFLALFKKLVIEAALYHQVKLYGGFHEKENYRSFGRNWYDSRWFT